MSSHDRNIERGRYNNPIAPINQRICTRCELNEIDDEIHLLLHCNAMNNERKILFKSVSATINIQPTNDTQIYMSLSVSNAKESLEKLQHCLMGVSA